MTKAKNTLLIVEDDKGLRRQLRWSFEDYNIVVADDHDSAIAQMTATEAPVVTLDLGLPPDPDGAVEGQPPHAHPPQRRTHAQTRHRRRLTRR